MKFPALKTIFNPDRILGCSVGALVATLLIQHPEQPSSPAQWVKLGQETPLKPCFGYRKFFHKEALADSVKMEAGTAALDTSNGDMIVPYGPWKGFAVPKDCFAVTTNVYGYTLAVYERPWIDNENRNMDIPFWTPSAFMAENPDQFKKSP